MQKHLWTLVAGIFLSATALLGQNSDQGNWLMYFGNHKLSKGWSVHTELQYRHHSRVPNNPEQVLSRVGLNYHASATTMLTAGYGFIPSYADPGELGNPSTVEHRIWQQMILVHKDSRVKFEHRYRVEQRWVDDKEDNIDTWSYKGRLRYRLMLTIPIGKPNLEDKTWFVGVYDEVFINTQRTFFDRNRLYAAAGYKLNSQLSFQAGVLHQEVRSSGGKFYAQFAVFLNTGSWE